MVDIASPVLTPVSEDGITTSSLTRNSPSLGNNSSAMDDIRSRITFTDIATNNVEVIPLRKDNGGFGLSIVGGTDSQHLPGENGIFVSYIKPGGPADVCGKLVPGDEIIAVNNISLSGKRHKEVVNMIANADDFATFVVDHTSEKRILQKDGMATVMESITGTRNGTRGHNSTVSHLFGPQWTTIDPQTTIAMSEQSAELPPHLSNFHSLAMRNAQTLESTDNEGGSRQTSLSSINRNLLHATSSFGSLKAEADSTGWPRESERDEDEMSTITDASTNYFNDDIPPTPRRPYSILDSESPYAGVIYGCVGVAVICVVGYFVVKRLTRRVASR